MLDTLLLNDLAIEDIHGVVRAALQRGSAADVSLDTDRINNFLASVDWSSPADSASVIARLLGQLEHWTTENSEGDLDIEAYAALLSDLVEAGAQVREDPSTYDAEA